MAKGLRIQDPIEKPTARPVIDTTHLVLEKPLASKPPAKNLNTERRSKQKHDPSKQMQAEKPAAPVKPKPTTASKLSSKRKLTE